MLTPRQVVTGLLVVMSAMLVPTIARATDLELQLRNDCPVRQDDPHPTDYIQLRVRKRGTGHATVRVDRHVTFWCAIASFGGDWEPSAVVHATIVGLEREIKAGDKFEWVESVQHSALGKQCPAQMFLHSVDARYTAVLVGGNSPSTTQHWGSRCNDHQCQDRSCPCPADDSCVEESECQCGPQRKCHDGTCVCASGSQCWCTGTCISAKDCHQICRGSERPPDPVDVLCVCGGREETMSVEGCRSRCTSQAKAALSNPSLSAAPASSAPPENQPNAPLPTRRARGGFQCQVSLSAANGTHEPWLVAILLAWLLRKRSQLRPQEQRHGEPSHSSSI
jgi:hypothetical protein